MILPPNRMKWTLSFKIFRSLVVQVLIILLVAPASSRAVGMWSKINNYPSGNAGPGHKMLLTDGSVMVQASGGTAWYSLTPDNHGHYTNGNWSVLKRMNDSREYYSSDVMKDGRVFVAGGEDGSGDSTAEIFDPTANAGIGSWTYIPPPTNLFNPSTDQFSDSDSILLTDGTILITPVTVNSDPGTLIYDGGANAWSSALGDRQVSQDEATWVKLPDDSILTIDINESNNPNTAERYIPSLSSWIAESNTPVSVDGFGREMGPAFLISSNRAFFFCGSGHTLYYTATGTASPGAWSQGPDMPLLNTNQYPPAYFYATNNSVVSIINNPAILTTEDTPAAMLSSGKILCQLSRDGGHDAAWFYEYDPVAETFTPAPCPTNPTPGSVYLTASLRTDATSMLLLPDGTVLYNDTGGLYVYQPDSTPPLAAGKPAIASVSWNANGSLHLAGTLFNGISQGTSQGDDEQQDSNFPLVQFTDGSGNVSYGRTFNWSTAGVYTGNRLVSTDATAPAGITNSPVPYSLRIVANGFASDPISFYGPVWVDFNYTGATQNGNISTPYKTLAAGTNAVATGGAIFVKPGDSSETMTISKPMTIIAVGGPATIGY